MRLLMNGQCFTVSYMDIDLQYFDDLHMSRIASFVMVCVYITFAIENIRPLRDL